MKKKVGYKEIAKLLRDDIFQGKYQPDKPIISTRRLALLHNVSIITANKAVNSLVDEGILERYHGSGTYLTNRVSMPKKFRLVSCGQNRFIGGTDVDYSMQRILNEDVFEYLAEQCSIEQIPVISDSAYPEYEKFFAEADAIISLSGYMTPEMINILKKTGKPVIIRGCCRQIDCPFHQIIVNIRYCMDEIFEKAPDVSERAFVIISSRFPDVISRGQQYLRELILRGASARKIRFTSLELPLGDSGRLCGYQYGLEHASEFLGKFIFSSSDFLSFGLVEALREKGIEAGKDYQLVSFDNFEDFGYRAFKEPMLTSIGYSTKEMAEMIIELLDFSVTRQKKAQKIIKLPSYLKVRRTGLK